MVKGFKHLNLSQSECSIHHGFVKKHPLWPTTTTTTFFPTKSSSNLRNLRFSPSRVPNEFTVKDPRLSERKGQDSLCHLDAILMPTNIMNTTNFNLIKKHTHVPIYAQKQFFSLFFQNSRSFWGSLACLKKSWILSVGQSFSNYQTWIHIFYFLFCKKKSLPNTMIRDYVTAAVPKTPQKHGPFNWS